jgi:dihydrofolate synthase / folylpolyglutamate synthase
MHRSEISEQEITGKIARLSVPSRLGVKTTLEPVRELLAKLDHPERMFPILHVGGTSGKGSTSTFLADILTASGYKVGLFTKPHLSTVRERFVVDKKLISPAEIMALLEHVPTGLTHTPTWFELMTALAFLHFAERQVDVGIIEVGLGGCLDATNVVDPLLSILTNVGLDHTDILGNTVELIAADKAGIIKPGRTAISGVTQPSVIEIVEQRCAQQGSALRLAGRDFRVENAVYTGQGSTFDLIAQGRTLKDLRISMLGRHQVHNAALAIAASLELGRLNYSIRESALRDALARTFIAGRMELIPTAPGGPTILLDGAHSPPKMAALAESLHTLFPARKLIGVLAFSKGHDYEKTLEAIAPFLQHAVLTEFDVETDYGNKRAMEVAELAHSLRQIHPEIGITLQANPVEALNTARGLALPGDRICVTGSIFLVGQLRPLLVKSV